MTPEEQNHWLSTFAGADCGVVAILKQLKSHPTAFDPMYEWDSFLAAAPFEVVVAEAHKLLQIRMSEEQRENVKLFSERCYEVARAGDEQALSQCSTEFCVMLAAVIAEVVHQTKPRKL